MPLGPSRCLIALPGVPCPSLPSSLFPMDSRGIARTVTTAVRNSCKIERHWEYNYLKVSRGAGDQGCTHKQCLGGTGGPGEAPSPWGNSPTFRYFHCLRKPCTFLSPCLPDAVPLPGMLHPSCLPQETLLHFKDSLTCLLCDAFFNLPRQSIDPCSPCSHCALLRMLLSLTIV